MDLTLSVGKIEARDEPAFPTKTFFVTRPFESKTQCFAVTTILEATRTPEQKPVDVAEYVRVIGTTKALPEASVPFSTAVAWQGWNKRSATKTAGSFFTVKY
jgi:hypothetical protein